MKIVIDADRLLREGQITQDEYTRFKALAVEETGSLAFNILIAFGVVATAVGAHALFPSGMTALFLGLAIAAGGVFLSIRHEQTWGVLGAILLLVGSLMASGGIIFLADGGFVGFATVTILLLAAAIVSKSGLLTTLSVFSLSASVGAATGYEHAAYMLCIRQPTITVILFGFLSFGAYHLSKILPPKYARLAIIFARTSLIVVNFGFWIGSLWGDTPGQTKNEWHFHGDQAIPDWVFVIGWAVGLIGTGIWAGLRNKRWVVNLTAVFGAIHFYTQYFERLSASPASIFFAGLLALAIALGIFYYNKISRRPVPVLAPVSLIGKTRQ